MHITRQMLVDAGCTDRVPYFYLSDFDEDYPDPAGVTLTAAMVRLEWLWLAIARVLCRAKGGDALAHYTRELGELDAKLDADIAKLDADPSTSTPGPARWDKSRPLTYARNSAARDLLIRVLDLQ